MQQESKQAMLFNVSPSSHISLLFSTVNTVNHLSTSSSPDCTHHSTSKPLSCRQ